MTAERSGQKKILIVEDFSALRQAMRDVLNLEGFQVDQVANGKEAVDYLKTKETPNAMIIDYRLPVMGGADLLDWMKSDPKYQSIFTIATSAASNETHCKTANHFMKKPLDMNALIQLLREKC